METPETYFKQLGKLTDNDYNNLNLIKRLVDEILSRDTINEISLKDLDQILQETTILSISYRDRIIRLCKQNVKITD